MTSDCLILIKAEQEIFLSSFLMTSVLGWTITLLRCVIPTEWTKTGMVSPKFWTNLKSFSGTCAIEWVEPVTAQQEKVMLPGEHS